MSELYPEYAYKGAAIGDLKFRNNVILASDVRGKLERSERNECYTTIARFTEDYLKHRNETGTVEGYVGSCYVDTLWFDVDDENLDNSLIGAFNLLMTLENAFGVDRADIRVFFSGKKGFHVGIPTTTFSAVPSPQLPRALKHMAQRIAGQAGVTIDHSIYRTNSLLRLPNTVNAKSGLFKIPLPLDGFEALTIDDILDMAVKPKPPIMRQGAGAHNEQLSRLYQKGLEEAQAGENRRVEIPVLNNRESEMPRFDKVCMFRMLKGVPSGHRNEVCLRLADHFRKKGFPLSVTTAALLQWNRLNEAALDEVDIQDVVNRVYDSDYDFGCNDPILDRYCHKECHLYDKKYPDGGGDLAANILTVEEARAKYQAYIRDRDKAKVSWGIEFLDEKTRMIAPGQVACIMARAGVGKTALVINCIRKNSEAKVPSLFCSLEQLAEEIWERMAQNACEQVGTEIEEAFYSRESDDLITHYATKTAAAFEHALICDKDRLTVGQLMDYVRAAEEKTGEKVRLLVVDYLGRMRGEGRDHYQKMSDLAIGLKQVAKECELAVLVIVQVNRSGGHGFEEVTMDMARDSGQIEEAMDYMVGMWRSNENEKTTGRYTVRCQINKNRKGENNISTDLTFRADVMRFEDANWREPTPADYTYTEDGEILGVKR
jgi:replicative DNA helicase